MRMPIVYNYSLQVIDSFYILVSFHFFVVVVCICYLVEVPPLMMNAWRYVRSNITK